jgi:hypothetical protein
LAPLGEDEDVLKREGPLPVLSSPLPGKGLIEDGFPLTWEDVAGLSPYITRKIKRFGDYVIDLSAPEPLDGALALAL